MTMVKVTVSIPPELHAAAKAEVKAGRAASVSAVVAEALHSRVVPDDGDLEDVLAWMDEVYGPGTEEDERWLKEQWERIESHWTRARSSAGSAARSAPAS